MPGTIDMPWQTLQWSFDQLAPGDTLYIRGGRYFEKDLIFSPSGAPGNPIVVRSYPGEEAIVDPTEALFRVPGNDGWMLVNAATGEYMTKDAVGYGVVRAFVDGIPGYENDRMSLIHYERVDDLRATTEDPNGADPFYTGPGTFEMNNRPNIRLSKTDDLRAMEARYGTVLWEENANPADYPIILTSANWAVSVRGNYLDFLDLVFEPAYSTIAFGQDVHDVRFTGCTVWVGRNGFASPGHRVHNITITESRIYGDNTRWVFLTDQDSDFPSAPAEEHRTTSISIDNGAHDWEISYNHIRGSAQYLIEATRHGLVGLPMTENISIHHNNMENAADDAMKFEGTDSLGSISVYENFISNCFRAVSAGQLTPVFKGPLLIYRNVVASLRNPPVNRVEGMYAWNGGDRYGYEYMFKLAGSSFTTSNTHIYHNTLALLNSGGKGINFMPEDPTDGRFANNLFMTVNGRVNNPYRMAAGQVVDGNLYWKMNTLDTERLTQNFDTITDVFVGTGLEPNGQGAVPKRGTDPQLGSLALSVENPADTLWTLTAGSERCKPWHFLLDATSPARDSAIAIPPHPVLGALPDTRPSVDVGALPFGTVAADFDFFPFDPNPNVAPEVDAGRDRAMAFSGHITLEGSISDDGHPTLGRLATRWVVVGGPGQVEFDDPTSPTSGARFTDAGIYTLQLIGSDGEETVSDQMTVDVRTTAFMATSQPADSTDDAEEKTPVNINLTSPDLDLGLSEGQPQIVGLRFPSLAVPQGAVIARAWIDFVSDDVTGGASNIEFRAELSDSAESFSTALANLSLRPTSAAMVPWHPIGWKVPNTVIPSPDLTELVQTVVDRPGWASGNALGIMIAGDVGRREAYSWDGDANLAPKLFVEYVPIGTLVGVPDQARVSLRAWVAPNPMTRAGTINFSTPRSGSASAELFDVRGRRIGSLLDSPRLEAGTHQLRVGQRLSPGVYFYRIRAAGDEVSGRFLILR